MSAITVSEAQLIAHEEERANGRTQDMIERWFSLAMLSESVILGAFSWSAMERRHRWLLRSGSYDLAPNLTVTYPDIARSYLRLKYPNWKPRVNTVQYGSTVKAEQPPPFYALRGRYPDMVYLDMKSAYWQILQVVGWDVDYSRGRFLGVRSSVQDFPYPQVKLSRNTLVSVGVGHTMTYWTGSSLKVVGKRNPMTNKVLWIFVHDVLHNIAHEMIERAGAVYVATDGYILPQNNLPQAAQICAEWGGLVMRPKSSGDAIIGSARQYEIGTAKTVYLSEKGRPLMQNINPQDVEWLKTRYARLAQRVSLIL